MKDKVLNSNSRRQGRTENRTSFPRFSASRALRETKPRSKRRVSPRVRRAAEPHPQPRCIVHRASLRKGGTNSYHFFGKTTAMFENSQLEEEGVLSLSSIPFIAKVDLPRSSIGGAGARLVGGRCLHRQSWGGWSGGSGGLRWGWDTGEVAHDGALGPSLTRRRES